MKLRFTLFLFIISISYAVSAEVDTLTVYSKSMNKNIKNVVITPENYGERQNLPVVYLLHGAGGDYRSWINQVPEIKTYADQYNIIIVSTDGGRTSWYWDSPIDESMKYETYVSKELIEIVDKKYKTIAAPEGRAITGLSMGGHGGFYLAFKHQDVWGAAGSQSGGVDFRPFPNNWDMAKRLGEYSDYPENWEKNTVINMLHLLDGAQTKLKLVFECGTSDFFYDGNKRLHQKMLQMNIPHDYTERPGGHTWDYWRNSIKYQLLFFDDFFKKQG